MIKHKKFFSYFRWLLSAVALYLVWRMINLNELLSLLDSVRIQYIFIALSISFLIRFSVVYRWSLLIQTQGYQVSEFKLFKIMLISDAVGTFLPSNLSREGIKAFVLWKYIGKGIDCITSIALDRFSGLFALAGIAIVCSLLSYQTLNNSKFIVLSGVFFGVCILISLMMFNLNNSRIAKKFLHLKIPYWEKLISHLSSVLESLKNFGKHKRTLVKVFGLATVIQLLRIIFIFCMSRAIGIDVPFIYFAVFLPIVMLLFMLPISIGGLGVQEAAFIYFFSPYGMLAEEAVALSLLCYTAVILWLLIGWIIYAKEGMGIRKGALAETTASDYKPAN